MSVERDISEIKADIRKILERIEHLEKENSSGVFSIIKGAAFIATIDKISKIEKTVNELKNRR